MNDGYSAQILLVIVIVAAVIGVAIYNYTQEQKRREALVGWAWSHGYEFYPIDVSNIPERYVGFDWIAQGHNRSAKNVIPGKLGNFDFKAFDYVYYTTQHTKNGSREVRHEFSAITIDTDVCFQSLLIRPEGVLDKMAGAIGFDDIDFESDEFSRKFYVKSSVKKFAYDVVHQRMMEYLMANPGWSVHLLGRSIMIVNGGKFSAEDVAAGLCFMENFLKQFPDYLWQQLRFQV